MKKTTITKTTVQSPDIFNSALVKGALQNMTPEQLEGYQKIGEKMYGTIDIPRNEIINNVNPPTEEKLKYIIEGLKSGLAPGDMSEEELNLMIEYYGENWFEKFGITKEDIGDMAKKMFEDHEKYRKCGRNQKCPCGSGKKYKVCHYSKMNKLPKYVQTKTLNMFQ